MATGYFEFWVIDVDLVKPKPKKTLPCPLIQRDQSFPTTKPPPLILPKIYTPEVACIYNVTGKCKDMLNPVRFDIIYKALDDAILAGIHVKSVPSPESFASKLLGLLSCSALHDNTTPMNIKVKDLYMLALPLSFHSALQKWALATQEQMASPLDPNPSITSSTGTETLATES